MLILALLPAICDATMAIARSDQCVGTLFCLASLLEMAYQAGHFLQIIPTLYF